VRSLTERRIGADWQTRFGHPVLRLEPVVEPRRFQGGVSRAANWIEQRVLAINRWQPRALGHRTCPSRVHPLIAWNDEEDRRRIRTGFGPENMARLRRFAGGSLTSCQKPAHTLAEMLRTRCFRMRLVFDYLRMTNNSVTGEREH
jgi:hypothetical protein